MVALADTPWIGINLPDCIASNTDRLTECAVSKGEALERSATNILSEAAERVPAVTMVDLNDWVCPREQCAPVIGGVIVYRDAHHLTGTYAKSLAPRLAEALTPLIEEDAR